MHRIVCASISSWIYECWQQKNVCYSSENSAVLSLLFLFELSAILKKKKAIKACFWHHVARTSCSSNDEVLTIALAVKLLTVIWGPEKWDTKRGTFPLKRHNANTEANLERLIRCVLLLFNSLRPVAWSVTQRLWKTLRNKID